jgi:hypothetical protein
MRRFGVVRGGYSSIDMERPSDGVVTRGLLWAAGDRRGLTPWPPPATRRGGTGVDLLDHAANPVRSLPMRTRT